MRERRSSKDNRWRKGQPSLTIGAGFSLLAASQNRRRACTAASCPPHEPAGHDLPSPRTPSAGLVSPWPTQEPAGHDGGLVRRLSARLPECLSSPIWRDTSSGGFERRLYSRRPDCLNPPTYSFSAFLPKMPPFLHFRQKYPWNTCFTWNYLFTQLNIWNA